jgi:hypothetical protein
MCVPFTMSAMTAANAAATPSTLPAGYTIASTPRTTAPAGQLTIATATCPGKTRPIGGGVYTDSDDLAVNEHGSYPSGAQTWTGSLSNASARDTDLIVYAVCVNRPGALFTVNSQTFTAPRNGQGHGSANCPSGVVVGGGVHNNISSVLLNVGSSYAASTTSWAVTLNNGVSSQLKYTVVAICRDTMPAGYSIQTGTTVDNPSGADTLSSASCPGSSVPLSGGANSSSTSVSVNLNTSFPQGNGWSSYANNSSAADNTVFTQAICAGT